MSDLLAPAAPRRSRSLTADVVQSLSDRIRDGSLAHGTKLPKEVDLMVQFGVSRTVVREAMSRLQAAGMVEVKHGIGAFVVGMGDASTFRIAPDQLATLSDVIAVLELRMAVECESAGLAAARRTEDNLRAIRSAMDAFTAAVDAGRDPVGPDFQFHLEIARATQNSHFADIMGTLGGSMIPRARLESVSEQLTPERRAYLQVIHGEHEGICNAIAARDPEGARAAMRLHLSNGRERRRRAMVAA
jgi:DNA-binding FadR family transcriptional regulator